MEANGAARNASVLLPPFFSCATRRGKNAAPPYAMITPKPFQQTYIDNVLGQFLSAKGYYDSVTTDFDCRRIFAYNGAVLIKAPTGAGKTIMAGAVAEKFSA